MEDYNQLYSPMKTPESRQNRERKEKQNNNKHQTVSQCTQLAALI